MAGYFTLVGFHTFVFMGRFHAEPKFCNWYNCNILNMNETLFVDNDLTPIFASVKAVHCSKNGDHSPPQYVFVDIK